MQEKNVKKPVSQEMCNERMEWYDRDKLGLEF